jgi:hypothetical protein
MVYYPDGYEIYLPRVENGVLDEITKHTRDTFAPTHSQGYLF